MANELTVKQENKATEEETRPGRTYVPNVEIRETDDAMWLWADMPGVSQGSVEARMESGVLELRLPKAEEARPRRIPISVN